MWKCHVSYLLCTDWLVPKEKRLLFGMYSTSLTSAIGVIIVNLNYLQILASLTSFLVLGRSHSRCCSFSLLVLTLPGRHLVSSCKGSANLKQLYSCLFLCLIFMTTNCFLQLNRNGLVICLRLSENLGTVVLVVCHFSVQSRYSRQFSWQVRVVIPYHCKTWNAKKNSGSVVLVTCQKQTEAFKVIDLFRLSVFPAWIKYLECEFETSTHSN